jgi:hypothetical protein
MVSPSTSGVGTYLFQVRPIMQDKFRIKINDAEWHAACDAVRLLIRETPATMLDLCDAPKIV